MTDPDNTQTSEASTGQTSTVPERMSELLPLVAQRLREHGVIRVHARYEREDFAFIFTRTNEHPLPKPTAVETACAIRDALRSISKRRYPNATKTDGTSGYFEWDLVADTFVHEHVVAGQGSTPKFPHVHVQLSGEDGNVFSIIGKVQSALRQSGASDDDVHAFWEQVSDAGSYDEALLTIMRWVDVS